MRRYLSHRDNRSLFFRCRLAKLIVLLSSGKDADTLQTSPQELMLALVDKYNHFTYPPNVHNERNGSVTQSSGKMVRTTHLLDVDPRHVFVTDFLLIRSF